MRAADTFHRQLPSRKHVFNYSRHSYVLAECAGNRPRLSHGRNDIDSRRRASPCHPNTRRDRQYNPCASALIALQISCQPNGDCDIIDRPSHLSEGQAPLSVARQSRKATVGYRPLGESRVLQRLVSTAIGFSPHAAIRIPRVWPRASPGMATEFPTLATIHLVKGFTPLPLVASCRRIDSPAV